MFGDFCGLDNVLASEFKHEEVICFCFASPQSQNGLLRVFCDIVYDQQNPNTQLKVPAPLVCFSLAQK